MAFCHGQGSQGGSHCCWVNGTVCPHYLNQSQLQQFISSFGWSGARLKRAQDLAQNVQNACGIALRILTVDPSLLTNRTAFNNAWNTHPDYVRDVRPHWVAVEEANGLPLNSYNCSTWGPGSGQCCYAEDAATNEAKAANLTTTAVTVRRLGGG